MQLGIIGANAYTMLVCTYCNSQALQLVADRWATSLRTIYDGPAVAFCLNIPEANAKSALSAYGIEPVCVHGPPAEQVRLLVETWARYLGQELRWNDPVAIYDGADIFFQRPLDTLLAEIAETGGLRAVPEPRRLEDSPSTARALLRVCGAAKHKQIWDAIRRRLLLNAGLMAGWAGELARAWQALLQIDTAADWGNDWCADQAWINYLAYTRHGLVLSVAPTWAYDLRFWPWERDQETGLYVRPVDGGERKVPVHVVHIGGQEIARKPY